MTYPEWSSNELDLLVSAQFDDELSEEQASRLNEILVIDEACRHYIRLVALRSQMQWIIQEQSDTQIDFNAAARSCFVVNHESTMEQNSHRVKTSTPTRLAGRNQYRARAAHWFRSRAAAVALSCVVLLFGGLLWLQRDNAEVKRNEIAVNGDSLRTHNATEQVYPDNDGAVATIVRKIDCIWEDDRWNVHPSVGLQARETIRITDGMMEIEFAGGALVVLEGPAQFTVESPNRGFLHSGRLTARVPERARGFTINSPTSSSVDLGTEFGLSVANDGTSEVHVFEGEVVTTPTKVGQDLVRQDVHLLENKGLRITSDGTLDLDVQASEEPFFRILLAPIEQHDRPALPTAKDLKVWYAADLLIRRDTDNRVSVWGDVLEGSNDVTEHAWQVDPARRPLFVPDAINGKPAIRFDGKATSLITQPLATGNDQTIFVVGVLAPPSGVPHRILGTQIINYNGPPNIVLQTSDDESSNRLEGRVFRGELDSNYDNVAQIRSGALPYHEPFLLAYRYSYSENRAALYVNGSLVGQTDAPAAASVTSPKFIGSHYQEQAFLHSDLAELMIFDRAITEQEIESIHGYLSDKYALNEDKSPDRAAQP